MEGRLGGARADLAVKAGTGGKGSLAGEFPGQRADSGSFLVIFKGLNRRWGATNGRFVATSGPHRGHIRPPEGPRLATSGPQNATFLRGWAAAWPQVGHILARPPAAVSMTSRPLAPRRPRHHRIKGGARPRRERRQFSFTMGKRDIIRALCNVFAVVSIPHPSGTIRQATARASTASASSGSKICRARWRTTSTTTPSPVR